MKKFLYFFVVTTFISSFLLTTDTLAQQTSEQELVAANVYRDGSVMVFEIDNPPANLVSVHVMRSLNQFMDMAAADDEVKALVITGKGDIFSASGSDEGIETLGEMTPAQYAMATYDRIEQFHLPVVAAVNGNAGQGGLELTMAADIRVASDQAIFEQREVLLGVIPGFGGLQRLPELVGMSLAKDMIFTGRSLTAEEALGAGLVSRTSVKGSVLQDAVKLAQSMADTLPRNSFPSAKERLFQSRNQSFSDALRSDLVVFDRLVLDPAFQARLRADQERLKAQD